MAPRLHLLLKTQGPQVQIKIMGWACTRKVLWSSLLTLQPVATVFADVTRLSGGDFTIEFNTAPASNGIRVLIQNVN